tara:strand:+ start:2245 stop:3066 length:822 start_codon:yes stop_codon:yes gene_type:complete
MPKDQDVFDSSSLADPSTYAARFNVLTESELGRGAIGHRHVPATYSLPSGIHSKFGGHGSNPLLASEGLYQNAPNEGTTGSGFLYPAWNKDSYGSTVMRITPAGAPYGPVVYSYPDYGWGIVAPGNSSTGAAELAVNINYSAGTPLADGTAAIDVAGWAEASNGSLGTSVNSDTIQMANGPILAVAAKIGGYWYVIPDSMAMYSGALFGDSIHTRTRITATVLKTLVPDGTSLEAVALVVCVRHKVFVSGIEQPGILLGNWGLSLDPFISEAI